MGARPFVQRQMMRRGSGTVKAGRSPGAGSRMCGSTSGASDAVRKPAASHEHAGRVWPEGRPVVVRVGIGIKGRERRKWIVGRISVVIRLSRLRLQSCIVHVPAQLRLCLQTAHDEVANGIGERALLDQVERLLHLVSHPGVYLEGAQGRELLFGLLRLPALEIGE